VGDIVVSGEGVTSPRPFTHGEILSLDRVAVTAAEKRELRESTGASAIEMESAAVAAKPGVGRSFRCIKVVSDIARKTCRSTSIYIATQPAGFRGPASHWRRCATP